MPMYIKASDRGSEFQRPQLGPSVASSYLSPNLSQNADNDVKYGSCCKRRVDTARTDSFVVQRRQEPPNRCCHWRRHILLLWDSCKSFSELSGCFSHAHAAQDFRSSDGLYNLVKQQYPDVVMKGRDLFDASLFRDKTSTAVFYTFISGLKMAIDQASPSPTHHFLHTLNKRGKLLRSYTQNIDGLEERSGLMGTGSPSVSQSEQGVKSKIGKDVKNIQLHGDIHRVRCTVCSVSYPCTREHVEVFQKGTAPDCPECKQRCEPSLCMVPIF